jgi:large subunit ribosomal protein L24e
MESTLKAMKRVLEIRQARQARFIKNRLQPDLEAERADNIKEIEKNIDLVLASTSQKRKEVDHFIKEVKGDREMEVE